jgi:uridine kinase
VSALVIGIAGGSGSGKTTVARKMAEAVRPASVAFVDMDAYYRNHVHLTFDERRKINWDHPDALDLDLFVDDLSALKRGDSIWKPVYDFATHLRSATSVEVAPSDVVVVDGIMLLADERTRALCDIKVYVDADADIRLVRRIRRDTAKRGRPLHEVLDQYVSTVHPMHLQFVEPSKRYADIIIPRGGHNSVVIDMLAAQVRQRLSARGGA